MNRYFASAPASVRTALVLLGIGLGSVLLFYALWQPAACWRERAEMSYTNHRADLDWVKAHIAVASPEPEKSSGPVPVSILNTAKETAQLQKLTSLVITQDDKNGLHVTFDHAAFNPLVKWLISLNASHHLQVDQLSLERTVETGIVKGEMTLHYND